jgi:hypothetical protein
LVGSLGSKYQSRPAYHQENEMFSFKKLQTPKEFERIKSFDVVTMPTEYFPTTKRVYSSKEKMAAESVATKERMIVRKFLYTNILK